MNGKPPTRILAGALAAAALCLANAAEAAPQFDLVCRSEAGQPLRLSLDVPARAWCVQPCAIPQPIARIDPGVIWLGQGEPPWPDPRWRSFIVVNRMTGVFVRTTDQVQDNGHCDPAAFTPIPPPRF